MKRLLITILVLAAVVGIIWLLSRLRSKDHPMTSEELAPTPGLPWFEDVTVAAGIDFTHFDSATADHFIEETMHAGVGWIDFNMDGWPDLVCVQGGPVRPIGAAAPTSRLYRNRGDGTFEDMTATSGLTRTGVGNGCAVGDYDNDGFDDLLITYVGGIALYHNEGWVRGSPMIFREVTAEAGLNNPHYATSAAWGDIDGDGFLDLYICNYVELTRTNDPHCQDASGVKIGCAPTAYAYTTHRLYRNRGDRSFEDITVSSGVAKAKPAPGLGVVLVDMDGNGRLDIYVANDMNPAFLFRNLGGGKFEELAQFAGCAYDAGGVVMAGMGVAAGDVYRNGRPALFVTNYQNLPNILFVNRGDGSFRDESQASGLGGPSLSRLGFGAAFLDADLDGLLDVAVANGHVQRPAQQLYGVSYPQQAQLFIGKGLGKFEDVSDKAGGYFRERFVGRGLAVADFNGDGKPDLVFGNNAGPYKLLRNATPTDNRGLTLELIGDARKSNRNAIGAKVVVDVGGRKQTSWVLGGGSYLSASDRSLTLGLGTADRADRVTVRWPSGQVQEFLNVGAGRWQIIEGTTALQQIRPSGN
jgi:hypothetical protein